MEGHCRPASPSLKALPGMNKLFLCSPQLLAINLGILVESSVTLYKSCKHFLLWTCNSIGLLSKGDDAENLVLFGPFQKKTDAYQIILHSVALGCTWALREIWSIFPFVRLRFSQPSRQKPAETVKVPEGSDVNRTISPLENNPSGRS